jgi:hypothetical protein
MQNHSPVEIIAEEAGLILGRVEREATLTVKALAADIQRRDTELELRMVRLEQAAAERLASLQNGQDGKTESRGLLAKTALLAFLDRQERLFRGRLEIRGEMESLVCTAKMACPAN